MIEKYFYIWDNFPSNLLWICPTIKKGVHIKIESQLLSINSADIFECYKLSSENDDKLDEKVDLILDYQLKISTYQKTISNFESSLTGHFLNHEQPEKNNKFTNQVTDLISKKSKYEQLKIQFDELLRLYQEIEKLIQFCEICKIKNHIEEINHKIVTIKSQINEITQEIEKLNVSFQTDERKLNLYYFVIGIVIGIVSSVIIQIIL